MAKQRAAQGSTLPAQQSNVLIRYAEREQQLQAGTLTMTKGEELPDFMRDDAGIAEQQRRDMSQFIRPARMKIMQPMSQGEAAEVFSEGDLILLPSLTQIRRIKFDEQKKRRLDETDVFHFVPLHFWCEWVKWAPRELKDKFGSVVETSQDFDGQLAVKSRDPRLRFEQIPGEKDKDGKPLGFRYVEHLNFMVISLDVEEAHGLPFVISFCRAEHKTGSNLASMITQRRAPSYGCIFAARGKLRTNDKGKWYGLDIFNPGEGLPKFVNHETLYATFKDLYGQVHELVSRREVKVDHDEEEGSTATNGPSSSEF